ncbi:MAG: metallophosphoesterase [Oscillospiraceae bacterium]|nr:metallophosphoesterase [Oscillospiraceae bacterium]
MICVTGDIHGDLSRFKHKNIKKLKKNDILIVCGDFGFLWDNTLKENRILKKIGRKKFYTLFVEGCHENYDLLSNYHEDDFCGGKVNVISGKLLHLKRGGIYELQGKTFFAFGGGQTKEIEIRRNSNTWYEAELPEPEEIKSAVQNLKEHKSEIDYIITHEPPASVKEFLDFEPRQISYMHTFFDAIKNDVEYKTWFFGKCHKNKVIPPKFRCLFDDVEIIA